jgi:hypothetical protein
VHSGAARIGLPAPDGDVDVERIQFDQRGAALGFLGGDERRARPAKRIENEIAPP